MNTRTGKFPIGFRRGWSDWQKNDLATLAKWAKSVGFDALDLSKVTAEEMHTLQSSGLKLGTADLLDFGNIMASDSAKRKDVIAQNIAYVKSAAALGAKLFFTVIIPGDHAANRSDNYKLAVESYAPICQAAADNGAAIVIEGWPGGDPWLSSLCCSPESTRMFLKDVPRGAALNYDPSHLIRLGIDHLRFLKEFIAHVKHVHAKDTELFPEAQYEFGLYQGAVAAKNHGFGQLAWRYTIPGHGVGRWSEIFKTLRENKYQGIVSVELEDENFNGSESGEKNALTHSLEFLSVS
ncbi:MAG TPA: sugar phosphate isomerase/epimerase [Tepidisphaeraceae bacterium]|jgi:sugar phosphate isomerase/epimerase